MLIIIGGIVLELIFVGVIIFVIISATSDKLICKSTEGNITIMCNETALTGYNAIDITYDFDRQQKVAGEIGTKAYIEEFEVWFSENTDGTFEKK